MSNVLSQLRQGIPDRFLAALAVAFTFIVFLTFDQVHWWQLKADYAFGWMAPIFAVYLIADRWPKVREIFRSNHPHSDSGLLQGMASAGAGLVFGLGLAFFLLGAFYRAGAGVTQPGSLALAVGFSGVFLGMVYFNVPLGWVGEKQPQTVWQTFKSDARLRATALFLFPALIWILSAPLVTAVENAISLFLLRKVVAVVFTVFNLLGYTLLQEGNVLVLPLGKVGVAEACSGIRSLTGCLFAGSFLAAVFLDRFWKKVVLIGLAMGLAFLTNLLRSLFLTAWAYAYGSDAIEGKLHDATGFAVLGLTVVGLFCFLPLFSPKNWHRWIGLTSGKSTPDQS